MILRYSVASLIAGLAILIAPLNAAQAQRDAPSFARLANEVDEIVTQAMQDLELVPGFSLAIYTPEGTYARGFGIADIETGEPASADTAFYIASTTKAFTGLTMNILHHRDVLDLDAILSAFAPDASFEQALSPDRVTLRALLTHTHGLLNEPLQFRSSVTGQHSPEIDWRIVTTETKPNADAPFGSFQYSNTGYNILTTLTDRRQVWCCVGAGAAKASQVRTAAFGL